MTLPGHIAIEARAVLRQTARDCKRRGGTADEWRDHCAPQWALDAVTQREVDAVISLTWSTW